MVGNKTFTILVGSVTSALHCVYLLNVFFISCTILVPDPRLEGLIFGLRTRALSMEVQSSGNNCSVECQFHTSDNTNTMFNC